MEDCGFARPVVPRLPEGFELKNLVVDDLGTGELIFHASCARGEHVLAMTVTLYLDYEDWTDGNYTNFEKDEGDPVPYEAGGIIHLLATNGGRPIAVWANGPAECAVCGDITMEELKQMIDSIYEQRQDKNWAGMDPPDDFSFFQQY